MSGRKGNVNEKDTRHTKVVESKGTRKRVPAFHPGGTPSVTVTTETVEIEVVTTPAGFVKMNVAKVGDGEMVGNADALTMPLLKIGLYVLVARADETIPPTGAKMDEFNP
jgi:hypothetical protein